MNNSIKAALSIIEGEDDCLLLIVHQIQVQPLQENKLNGLLVLPTPKVFISDNILLLSKPHDIPAQLLVVHVEVCFQQQDGPELLYPIDALFLQEFYIQAFLPSLILIAIE